MSDSVDEAALQKAVVSRLVSLGWKYISADELNRSFEDSFIESDLVNNLIRLNPVIASEPSRVDEIIPRLRSIALSYANDGLVAANQEMTKWLAGRVTHRFIGTDDFQEIVFIDFDKPSSNNLVVSDEVTFQMGTQKRRYDIVLWVNGIALVVGELKTLNSQTTSWLDAAKDIHDAYEPKTPLFFVSNVFSFATEGKELRYGAIRQPPETWLPWLSTTEPIPLTGLNSVLKTIDRLLNPQMVLSILGTYTFYQQNNKTGQGLMKVIPRYPQVEAVKAIVDRVKDPNKQKGLIWHHQGSGKTLLMAFAAVKLRQVLDLDAPTIVVVLDRLELIEQTQKEFSSVGLFGLKVAQGKDQLQKLLKQDARGIILTTIFRFDNAGVLNTRSNIIVMVDEAHRTQEGRLGTDMRIALPNAKFIGLTGTPISTQDRNTWETFGDSSDPGGVMNHYSVERSIADGATLPIHIETRLVDFHIDKEGLDEAFSQFSDQQSLDETEQYIIATQASRIGTVMKNPKRIQAVVKDILDHYRQKIAPLGLKAQIVVYNRDLCVDYYQVLSKLLDPDEQGAVIMTCAKDDPIEWAEFDLGKEKEALLKERFKDVNDPLKFLIVTAKLLTGFDAPIEGVMYLDKPIKAHSLFQAVSRTNRRWTNPNTGQEKLFGLVVDYIGIGQELAKAVAVKNEGNKKALPVGVDELVGILSDYVSNCLSYFGSVDRSQDGIEQLFQAQNCLPTKEQRESFAQQFLRAQGLFEFLWPHVGLRPLEKDYKWLARIYKSIAPSDGSSRLLWHRLGAKTSDLIYQYLDEVTISSSKINSIAIDAEALEVIKQLQIFDDSFLGPKEPPTVEDVIESLEMRLQAKLQGPNTHPVWKNLSERLESLRKMRLESASASVDFINQLLSIATEVIETEKAEEQGTIDQIKILDPNIGALSQILNEYGPKDIPVMVEAVVEKIDSIVRPVRGTKWQQSQPGDRQVRKELRLVLKESGLPPTGELFDKAYAYIKEHY